MALADGPLGLILETVSVLPADVLIELEAMLAAREEATDEETMDDEVWVSAEAADGLLSKDETDADFEAVADSAEAGAVIDVDGAMLLETYLHCHCGFLEDTAEGSGWLDVAVAANGVVEIMAVGLVRVEVLRVEVASFLLCMWNSLLINDIMGAMMLLGLRDLRLVDGALSFADFASLALGFASNLSSGPSIKSVLSAGFSLEMLSEFLVRVVLALGAGIESSMSGLAAMSIVPGVIFESTAVGLGSTESGAMYELMPVATLGASKRLAAGL